MPTFHGVQQYFRNLSMLSRNAKLYLVATVLQGLGFGIWGVIFNLYLKIGEVGFQADFIAYMFTVGAIATGFVALPAGLVCERIGSKKALLIGLTANLANIVQIVILQPPLLLFASLVSGLIGTVGWVASAPFMTENSKLEERTYLFSFSWAAMIIMGVVGSYLGGAMPDSINAFLGLSIGENGSAFGYRTTLGISTILTLVAIIPILLIREKKTQHKQRLSDLLILRNIRSGRTILKFIIPVGLIGFGAGFIVPLFNLFFSLKFSATNEQIGIMFALSNVTLGLGTFAAPILSKKLGKIRSIVLCEYFSMPFIMLTTLAPNLSLAASAFITRNALMNMAGPISSALQMELVTETERATTSGLLVMADNIPRAVTASFSGQMMTGSDFYTPFLFTAATYFVASTLFYLFFRKAETKAIRTFLNDS
ncbi:MFS transporter [Candidatus Bathyarchaeota archaeon]|nr:MFS transporter [Candidatus Bathyarchaeota archaeon]